MLGAPPHERFRRNLSLHILTFRQTRTPPALKLIRGLYTFDACGTPRACMRWLLLLLLHPIAGAAARLELDAAPMVPHHTAFEASTRCSLLLCIGGRISFTLAITATS